MTVRNRDEPSGFATVAAPSDDASLAVDDHGSDGDLSRGGRFVRQSEGVFHPLHLIHLSNNFTGGRSPPRWDSNWCTQEDSNL